MEDLKQKFQIPRRLAVTSFSLAALALVVEIWGGCGSCHRADGLGVAIAGLGVLGYALLVWIAWTAKWRWFVLGVVAAAAIHAALVLWMFVSGRWCGICIAAASVAGMNLTVLFVRGLVEFQTFEKVFIPTLFLGSALSTVAALIEERAETVRQSHLEIAKAVANSSDSEDLGRSTIRVTVFENEDCGYCRTFREAYLPELQRRLGGAFEVTFHDASEASWVVRTPTILIEDGPTFEGLPVQVETLRRAIVDASARRNN